METNDKYAFVGCNAGYNEANTVIFGAGYDCTSSFRPGSRFAPSEIRAQSFGIETYSPYAKADLSDFSLCDAGDLELPFGGCEKPLEKIEETAEEILKDGKLPFMIGGEHLVTLGAVKAAAKKYGGLNVIHFDAHADLRDEYLGEKLSHATVIRRCSEIIGGKIYQFGIRSGDKSEFDFISKSEKVETCLFNFDSLRSAAERLKSKPVYFTLDLDVLDTSVFPGTGTPEAGGVSFNELLSAFEQLRGLNIVGADVCEFCPPCDAGGISAAAACKAVREILILTGRRI